MSIVNLSHQTDDSLTCVCCSGLFLYFVVMLVNFKEFVTKQYADCQQQLWLLSLLYITLSATTAYRSVVALWLITEACWFKSPYVIMNMMTILSQMAVKTGLRYCQRDHAELHFYCILWRKYVHGVASMTERLCWLKSVLTWLCWDGWSSLSCAVISWTECLFASGRNKSFVSVHIANFVMVTTLLKWL